MITCDGAGPSPAAIINYGQAQRPRCRRARARRSARTRPQRPLVGDGSNASLVLSYQGGDGGRSFELVEDRACAPTPTPPTATDDHVQVRHRLQPPRDPRTRAATRAPIPSNATCGGRPRPGRAASAASTSSTARRASTRAARSAPTTRTARASPSSTASATSRTRSCSSIGIRRASMCVVNNANAAPTATTTRRGAPAAASPTRCSSTCRRGRGRRRASAPPCAPTAASARSTRRASRTPPPSRRASSPTTSSRAAAARAASPASASSQVHQQWCRRRRALHTGFAARSFVPDAAGADGDAAQGPPEAPRLGHRARDPRRPLGDADAPRRHMTI